jgi:hypothetical protein
MLWLILVFLCAVVNFKLLVIIIMIIKKNPIHHVLYIVMIFLSCLEIKKKKKKNHFEYFLLKKKKKKERKYSSCNTSYSTCRPKEKFYKSLLCSFKNNMPLKIDHLIKIQ